MLELRATIADLQLRERSERTGWAATEEQHGSVRPGIGHVGRAGVSGTIVGVGLGVWVQHARRGPGGAGTGEGEGEGAGASRKPTAVEADSSRRRVDGFGHRSSWCPLRGLGGGCGRRYCSCFFFSFHLRSDSSVTVWPRRDVGVRGVM